MSSAATNRSLYKYIKALPKVELHAHLNGCIRESTLFALADERNVVLPPSHFAPSVDIADTKERAPDSNPKGEGEPVDMNLLEEGNMYNCMPRSLQDCFDMFAEIPKCVNDLPALERITREALEDFDDHNVVYLELRSTPKVLLLKADGDGRQATKYDYIQTIIRVMDEYEEERKREQRELGGSTLALTCRYIAAVDRSHTVEEATETVDLAIQISQKEPRSRLVGIDLGGNPTRGNIHDFLPLFDKARATTGLKLTIHCAEIPCNEGDSFEEARAVLNFRPDRLGHALLLPPALQDVLEASFIPVETCPTSNVMTLELAKMAEGNLVHGLKEHPILQRWLKSNHPLAVGTDDPGVFDTDATKELLLLALAYDVDRVAISKILLSSMDYAFCKKSTIVLIKEKMKLRLQQLSESS